MIVKRDDLSLEELSRAGSSEAPLPHRCRAPFRPALPRGRAPALGNSISRARVVEASSPTPEAGSEGSKNLVDEGQLLLLVHCLCISLTSRWPAAGGRWVLCAGARADQMWEGNEARGVPGYRPWSTDDLPGGGNRPRAASFTEQMHTAGIEHSWPACVKELAPSLRMVQEVN